MGTSTPPAVNVANATAAQSVPLGAIADALDISKESKDVQEMYGIGKEPTDSYGRRCLIARRLIERGVRFVQLYINQHIWDTPGDQVLQQIQSRYLSEC